MLKDKQNTGSKYFQISNLTDDLRLEYIKELSKLSNKNQKSQTIGK